MWWRGATDVTDVKARTANFVAGTFLFLNVAVKLPGRSPWHRVRCSFRPALGKNLGGSLIVVRSARFTEGAERTFVAGRDETLEPSIKLPHSISVVREAQLGLWLLKIF